jgi:hypothetical protein
LALKNIDLSKNMKIRLFGDNSKGETMVMYKLIKVTPYKGLGHPLPSAASRLCVTGNSDYAETEYGRWDPMDDPTYYTVIDVYGTYEEAKAAMNKLQNGYQMVEARYVIMVKD